MGNSISENAVLTKAPSYRWWILVLNVLAYGHFFMTVQLVNAFSAYILADWGISATQLSILTTVTLAAFAFFSGAGAKIAGKFGLKKTVVMGIGLNILSSLLFPAFGNSFIGFMFLRIFQGLSGGIIASSMLSSTALWFPIKQRAFATGVLLGVLGVGLSIATFFAPRLAGVMSWQMGACVMSVVPGVLIGALYFLTAKEVKDMYPGQIAIADMMPADGQSVASIPSDDKPRSMKEITRTAKFWACVFSGFSSGWMTYAFPAFLPNLLVNDMNIDVTVTTNIMSATFFVAFIAAPLGGIISDRIFKGSRYQTVFIGNALLFIMLFLIPRSSVALLPVVLICAYSAHSICTGPYWSLPNEIVHPSIAGESAGRINILANIGSLSVTTILAFMADVSGSSASGLYLCMGIAAVSALCMLKVKQ